MLTYIKNSPKVQADFFRWLKKEEKIRKDLCPSDVPDKQPFYPTGITLLSAMEYALEHLKPCAHCHYVGIKRKMAKHVVETLGGVYEEYTCKGKCTSEFVEEYKSYIVE